MKPTIYRTYLEKETIGRLHHEKNGVSFDCFTLELPNLDNKPQVSCIPEGIYPCVYTQSAHIVDKDGKHISTYEILNVPNRSGIRIHSASFVRNLKGCCSLGYKKGDIDGDGLIDVAESRKAIHDFEVFMNYEQFDLVVTSEPNVSA